MLIRSLDTLDEPAVRALAQRLLNDLGNKEIQTQLLVNDVWLKQALIDKLTFELVVLRRFRFGRHKERWNPEQKNLF